MIIVRGERLRCHESSVFHTRFLTTSFDSLRIGFGRSSLVRCDYQSADV